MCPARAPPNLGGRRRTEKLWVASGTVTDPGGQRPDHGAVSASATGACPHRGQHLGAACDLHLLFQCGNMAREGLRTLVVAKRALTEEQYQDFEVSRLSSPFCPMGIHPSDTSPLTWVRAAGVDTHTTWSSLAAPERRAVSCSLLGKGCVPGADRLLGWGRFPCPHVPRGDPHPPSVLRAATVRPS